MSKKLLYKTLRIFQYKKNWYKTRLIPTRNTIAEYKVLVWLFAALMMWAVSQVAQADLVLAVGYDPIEMRTGWQAPWDPAKVIEFAHARNDHDE